MMKNLKNILAVVLFLWSLSTGSSFAATAEVAGSDGFAPVSYRDFARTVTMMGGVDIQNIDAADAYAEINYCILFQQKYLNDLEWHDLRKNIITRVMEKKDSYRTLFQADDAFIIGRYDPVKQSFVLDKDSALNGVGFLGLDVDKVFSCVAGERVASVYSNSMRVLLSQPFTLQEVRVPLEEAKRILPLIKQTERGKRFLYARLRFRVMSAPRKVHEAGMMELAGEMVSVDFFLDKELTMPITVLH